MLSGGRCTSKANVTPSSHLQQQVPARLPVGNSRVLRTSRTVLVRAQNKSWGNIVADAANVARQALSKVADSVGALVRGDEAVVPPPQQRRQRQQQQQPPQQNRGGSPAWLQEQQNQRARGSLTDLGPGPGAMGGLLGRAMGSLMTNAMQGLGEQLERTAAETRGVYDSAAARIQSSAKVTSRLGSVTVGPPMSQSSSTSSINGRVTKRTVLLLPIQARNGVVATAQVTVAAAAGGSSQQTIVVQLPGGGTIVVDDSADDSRAPRGGRQQGTDGKRQGGVVIDAEYTDLT